MSRASRNTRHTILCAVCSCACVCVCSRCPGYRLDSLSGCATVMSVDSRRSHKALLRWLQRAAARRLLVRGQAPASLWRRVPAPTPAMKMLFRRFRQRVHRLLSECRSPYRPGPASSRGGLAAVPVPRASGAEASATFPLPCSFFCSHVIGTRWTRAICPVGALASEPRPLFLLGLRLLGLSLLRRFKHRYRRRLG